MDKKLDKLLDSYVVADAGNVFLEGVMSRLFMEKVITRVHERRQTAARRHVCLRAAVFAAILLSGFWIGNTSTKTTTQSTLAYKNYLAQTMFGPDDLNDYML